MRGLRRVHLAATLCWICALHSVRAEEDAAQTITEALRKTNDYEKTPTELPLTKNNLPLTKSSPPGVVNYFNFDVDFNSTFDYYDDLSNEDTVTEASDYLHAESDNATGNSVRLITGTGITATGVYPFALHLTATIPGGTRPCTAALITAEYAITAASCVYDATTILVRAETLDGTGTSVSATAIVHPKYTLNTYNYDIALIKLLTPYTLSTTIAPIDIAFKFNTDSSKDLTGKSVRVIAFGETTANTATYLLNTQFMKVLSRARCVVEMRKRYIRPSSTQDCLDTDSGLAGGCNPADIGGIVTYKFDSDSAYKLAGVLNYYYSCGSATPNLFTRIGPFWDLIRKYVPLYNNIG